MPHTQPPPHVTIAGVVGGGLSSPEKLETSRKITIISNLNTRLLTAVTRKKRGCCSTPISLNLQENHNKTDAYRKRRRTAAGVGRRCTTAAKQGEENRRKCLDSREGKCKSVLLWLLNRSRWWGRRQGWILAGKRQGVAGRSCCRGRKSSKDRRSFGWSCWARRQKRNTRSSSEGKCGEESRREGDQVAGKITAALGFLNVWTRVSAAKSSRVRFKTWDLKLWSFLEILNRILHFAPSYFANCNTKIP